MSSLPDLIDNQRVTAVQLAQVLKELLSGGQRTTFCIATAYFNLEGLERLGESLHNVEDLRLLLGAEQEQTFVVTERLYREIEQDFAQASRGALAKLQKWVEYLQQSFVKVRRYSQGFLHGKAYIASNIPYLGAVGIVGSSNFTGAGLTTNLELNAVLKQSSAVQELQKWFELIWEQSEDYKQQLLALLTQFTQAYSPYEIYIKVLYEAFRDKLQSPLAEQDGQPSPIALADFQHEGYLAAREVLENYGGVLIADSVGLGKTFLALRLLDEYAYRPRETALVICPATLRDTVWRPLLETHAIPHRIESMERISQSDCPVEELSRYKVVVVDESHNFRNDASNRWNNLTRILQTGDTEKKIILLTATPVNNTVFDLYNQLRFITRDREDYFADSGIRDLKQYFVRAEKSRDTLYEILEAVAVRRSRAFIRRHYPNAHIDGQPLHFPERVIHTLHYNMEDSYGSQLYQQVANAIENLKLAPYQVDLYRKDLLQKRLQSLFEPELGEGLTDYLKQRGLDDQQVQRLVLDLGRQTALAHIMRVLYLKRLESSVHALRVSLKRQYDFQNKFLQVLRQGKLLCSADYHRWLLQFESSDDATENPSEQNDWFDNLQGIDTNMYDLAQIEQDVQHDLRLLENILQPLQEIDTLQDSKLQTLKRLLTTQLQGQKVLLFSYFKDTARYLYEYLRADEEVKHAFGDKAMAITDSDTKSDERRRLVQCFAPRANCPNKADRAHRSQECAYCHPEHELNLLISTDVLSEGQNLQDASIVINYDLHWNPVRMVQRIGRVDRIGSPHERIDVYNFHPEDKLEELLRLMERLYQKLDAINRSVGLDASVLGESPNPMDFNTLRRIDSEDQSVVDELEGVGELNIGEFLQEDLIQFLNRLGEQAVSRIPMGVGTAKHRDGGKPTGFFVAFRNAKTDRHYWLFHDDEANRTVTARLEAISHIRSQDGESPAPLPEGFDPTERIVPLRRYLVQQLNQVAHRLSKLQAPQNHVVSRLQAMPGSALRNELLKYFREPLPQNYLRELRQVWQQNRSKANSELLGALKRFVDSHPLLPVSVPETPEVREEDIECVAWMLVT